MRLLTQMLRDQVEAKAQATAQTLGEHLDLRRRLDFGGGARRHLQAVRAEGLQPGLQLHDGCGIAGREDQPPSRVVQLLQQGGRDPVHARRGRSQFAGHSHGHALGDHGQFVLTTSASNITVIKSNAA